MSTTRRDFLKAAGIVAVVGTAGLTGCTSKAAQRQPSGPQLPNEPNYKGWFDGTDNYDHTHDMRGKDAVTIQVGSKGNMGDFGFGPAAVAVSPHTTVTWEWTGRGGGHNVVADQGTFTSGAPVSDAGTTFEFTFDRPGVYKYVCEPHESMGMKGAVFVALGQPTSSGGAAA
ncbi:MAG TPA: halocyanin domain-containing protein [Halococcus sp.]|nr:halocyanin domain-containing protein [Halococcus sp.]